MSKAKTKSRKSRKSKSGESKTLAGAMKLARSLGLSRLIVKLPQKKNGSMKVFGAK